AAVPRESRTPGSARAHADDRHRHREFPRAAGAQPRARFRRRPGVETVGGVRRAAPGRDGVGAGRQPVVRGVRAMSDRRPPLAVSRGRRIAYLAVATLLFLFAATGVLLAVDVYLHHRVQYSAGVNVWGYRGDPVGTKKPGELRIVALGGSTAFG